MRRLNRTITAVAATAAALSVGATSASAYSISGGSYTGTATSDHTFTIGGAYTVSCSGTTYSGTATGAASTSFTPAYSGCTFFGFPASITVSGSSTLTADGDSGGIYHVSYHSSSTITIEVPIAGCDVTISGTRYFTAGSAQNYGSGIELELSYSGTSYTASGCPFPSGSDGTYESNGPVTVPGITVS
jgi:hypothetical protein